MFKSTIFILFWFAHLVCSPDFFLFITVEILNTLKCVPPNAVSEQICAFHLYVSWHHHLTAPCLLCHQSDPFYSYRFSSILSSMLFMSLPDGAHFWVVCFRVSVFSLVPFLIKCAFVLFSMSLRSVSILLVSASEVNNPQYICRHSLDSLYSYARSAFYTVSDIHFCEV